MVKKDSLEQRKTTAKTIDSKKYGTLHKGRSSPRTAFYLIKHSLTNTSNKKINLSPKDNQDICLYWTLSLNILSSFLIIYINSYPQ